MFEVSFFYGLLRIRSEKNCIFLGRTNEQNNFFNQAELAKKCSFVFVGQHQLAYYYVIILDRYLDKAADMYPYLHVDTK